MASRVAHRARRLVGGRRGGPSPTAETDLPPIPEGHVVGPPDWVGVGTQRSGTSWWHDQLMKHPRSHRVRGQSKERHHFDRFATEDFTEADIEGYHRLFPRPPGTFTGEWTPRYLYDFWTVPLLARAAPDARLLVMLRDPVERYRSGIADTQRRDTEAAAPDETPITARRRRSAAANDAFARSFYHQQLQRLFEVVPRSRVLVLQFEACIAEPEPAYRATLEFLGYDDVEFVPEKLAVPKNTAPGQKPELPAHLRERLVAGLRDDVVALAADLPDDIDLARWPNFARLG
jgi:hypothetical protein